MIARSMAPTTRSDHDQTPTASPTERDSRRSADESATPTWCCARAPGDRDAFGELWRRHYRSGVDGRSLRDIRASTPTTSCKRRTPASTSRSSSGGGPTGSFRAYLFTSIRNTAAAWGRARRETAIDELDAVEDPATSEQATDDALDRSLTHRAFRSLPTRWQEVLWYSEIEQMKPAEIAPLLGMKATAVAQLTFRAREGLREAWIQAHLRSVADGSDCQWTDRAPRRLRARQPRHAATARRSRPTSPSARGARSSRARPRRSRSRLALVLLPLTVGVAGTAGYLASIQGGGVPSSALAAMPSAVTAGRRHGGPRRARTAARSPERASAAGAGAAGVSAGRAVQEPRAGLPEPPAPEQRRSGAAGAGCSGRRGRGRRLRALQPPAQDRRRGRRGGRSRRGGRGAACSRCGSPASRMRARPQPAASSRACSRHGGTRRRRACVVRRSRRRGRRRLPRSSRRRPHRPPTDDSAPASSRRATPPVTLPSDVASEAEGPKPGDSR